MNLWLIFSRSERKPAYKHKGKILCRRGFYQWKIQARQPFDAKPRKVDKRLALRALWRKQNQQLLNESTNTG